MQKIIVLVGPTASGKSSLALKLAEKFPAEIISADSVQIYKYLNIGSDKPPKEILQKFPHHLVDRLELSEEYNAGNFSREASLILGDLQVHRKIGLVVGGTGLYIRALLHGLISAESVPQEVKDRVREYHDRQGLQYCQSLLAKNDPETATNLKPGDTQRILHALCFYLAFGKSLSVLQKTHGFQELNYEPLYIGLQVPRPEIAKRINQRISQMVQNGLIEETEEILKRGYSPELKPLRSIGYRQVVKYLNGEFDQTTMICEIETKTRQYAKRQMTWYAKNDTIRWFDPLQTDKIFGYCEAFFKKDRLNVI